MKYSVVVFCCVVLSVYDSANALSPSVNSNLGRDEPRHRREIPDECRPPQFSRPPPRHDASDERAGLPAPPPPPPVCCELPDLMDALNEPEVFGRCHRYVHDVLHFGKRNHRHHRRHHNKDVGESVRVEREADETENGASSKENHVDKFQEKKECFMSCVFNSTGLLLPDDMFNEELLSKKLSESVGNNSKWTSIAESAFKKCIAAAKEANSQSQKTCKAGPAEYMKCLTRELFFNCPSDIWTTSQECTDFKEKLEKCPNLMPFPPHRHHGPNHHHHHHHHHHNRHSAHHDKPIETNEDEN